MKLKKLSAFGFATAMMLSVASCSNDDIINDQPQVLDADQLFYMNISVSGENTRSRAQGTDGNYTYDPSEDPNFNVGNEQENAVKSVYLLFYDASGTKLKDLTIAVIDNNNDGAGADGTVSKDPNFNSDPTYNENALYQGTIQVAVNKGEQIPSYVLAFVNPVNTSFPDNEFGTLNLTEQTLREDLIGNNGSFAMSNSVYFGTDPVTGESNTRIMATPIQPDQIFTSKEKAQKALDTPENTVDIYVERYAAKVNFSVADGEAIKGISVVNSGSEGTNVEHYTLTFVPEYWAVNAIERKSYVTKTFFAANGSEIDFSKPATYDQINAVLGGANGWKWNNASYFRSYWGQSPAYYSAVYPRTADEIAANGGSYYSLDYLSFEDIEKEATAGKGLKAKAAAVANNYLYTRENTVQGAALIKAYEDEAGPRAAIASVVMVGHYEVTNAQNEKVTFEDDIFYVTGSEGSYTYFTPSNMKKYFMSNAINFYKEVAAVEPETEPTYENIFSWDNSEKVNWKQGVIDPDYKDVFELVHPSTDILGTMTLDSRFVTLQVNKDKLASLGDKKLFAEINGNIVEVTASNLTLVNTQLFSSVGTTRGFSNGHAFFNIPIQHLGYQRANNTNRTNGYSPNSTDFDWTKVVSGDFGVVRNHIYNIKVSKIEGLGNAIPNDKDPIVPPNDEEYWIGARIYVLNWAIVPDQNVEL